MDGLSADLTQALEESSKTLQQTVKRHNRKRKGKIRRSSNSLTEELSLHAIDFPNRSEASAGSDFDQVLKPQSGAASGMSFAVPTHVGHKNKKNIGAQREVTTDSEDAPGQRMRMSRSLLRGGATLMNDIYSLCDLPGTTVSAPEIESDSLNELSFEKKSTDHARRKRRAKLNASPQIVLANQLQEMELEKKPKPRPPHVRRIPSKESAAETSSTKRQLTQKMEVEQLSSESCYSDSSILTSDEATCDERAGEADDEQSDFFLEANGGPTCGIPVTHAGSDWWSNSPSAGVSCLQRIIYRAYPNLSTENLVCGKRQRRTRFNKYTRTFPVGHRRLRHHIKKPKSSRPMAEDWYNGSAPYPDKAAKRRKKYLPPNMNSEAFHGDPLASTSTACSPTSISFRVPDWRQDRHSSTRPTWPSLTSFDAPVLSTTPKFDDGPLSNFTLPGQRSTSITPTNQNFEPSSTNT